MQRSYTVLVLITILLLSAALLGCGGDNNETRRSTAVKITLAPSSLSLNKGQVQQVTPQALDENDRVAIVSGFTFSSSNPDLVSVSTAGAVCAGKWDTNFIVCTPGGAGTAQVTASAEGLTSNAVTVFVHDLVDRVEITPAAVDCKSQDQTATFTAQAFSGGNDITDSVGPFNWATIEGTVATVDKTENDGKSAVVKAKAPGRTGVVANVSGVNSTSSTFVVCGPKSIQVHVKDSTDTAFSVAKGATQDLVADVVDVNDVALTELTLNWTSNNPAVASVNSSGRVTSSAPGKAGIGVSCTPPSCNVNVNQPTYSNLVQVTVTGEPATTKVYVTSTDAPAEGQKAKLVVIDTANDTAGTPIELPQTPNSILMNANGSRIFLGSGGGLVQFDPGADAVGTTITGAPGKVLAAGRVNNLVVVSDTAANKVHVVDISNNGMVSLNIAGAKAAAFSPDDFKVLIVAGATLYVWTPTQSLRTLPLGGAANDVGFLPSGSFGYLAGGGAGVTARATCDNSLADSIATGSTPSFIEPLIAAETLLAVDGDSIHAVSATVTPMACPPGVSNTLDTTAFGESFIPRQLLVAPDDSRAFVLSELNRVLVYDIAAGTTGSIALADGAEPLSGGVVLDGTRVYVGASDNNVHRLNPADGTDSAQISVPFKPDLVAVRPR